MFDLVKTPKNRESPATPRERLVAGESIINYESVF